LLTVDNISVYYGEFRALSEVSLRVRTGQTTIVLGPNGAGKTTLLKAICGLERIRSGQIIFDGRPIHNDEPHKIAEAGIAMVPEGGRLFPSLSVVENLKIGAYLPRTRKYFQKSLDEVFFLFPILKERAKQMAGSMSGGERQMLAVARSLMSKPKILILDEPSAGLAPKVILSIFDFVERIKKSGYSILMVEQNATKALQLANRAYLFESGKLVFEGEKEDFDKNEYIKKAYLGI
jgi:branched-chain amino acid transport system ATP-binding protein